MDSWKCSPSLAQTLYLHTACSHDGKGGKDMEMWQLLSSSPTLNSKERKWGPSSAVHLRVIVVNNNREAAFPLKNRGNTGVIMFLTTWFRCRGVSTISRCHTVTDSPWSLNSSLSDRQVRSDAFPNWTFSLKCIGPKGVRALAEYRLDVSRNHRFSSVPSTVSTEWYLKRFHKH